MAGPEPQHGNQTAQATLSTQEKNREKERNEREGKKKVRTNGNFEAEK